MVISMLIGIVLYLLIGIPFSAIILRAAVAVANYFLSLRQGPPAMVAQAENELAQAEQFNRDLSNPFSPPSTISENRLSNGSAIIPPPSFARAYVITLVQSILFLLTGSVLGFASGQSTERPTLFLNVAVSFFVASAVLSAMAPTRFPRAMFVTFVSFLIIFSIMFAVGFTVFTKRVSA